MINVRMLLAGLLLMTLAGITYALSDAIFPSDNEYTIADAHDAVHDETEGTVLRTTSGQCVRTRWMSPEDECATTTVTQQPMVDKTVSKSLSREERTVYIGFNQTGLSPEMKQKLDQLAATLKAGQNVKSVVIVGYADRIGNSAYNEKLSKKRAENVQKYLISQGITKASVADTRWVGSVAPTTNCPDALKHSQLIDCLQQDRRVEVEVDYTPNAQAAQ